MSRVRSRALPALLLVFAVVFGGVVTAPSAQAREVTCASELGLSKPSPTEAKVKAPVVLVHGLWSDAGTWESSSMADAVAGIDGTVVHVFDYSSANSDWVTSGDTAHRLAMIVVCYRQLYAKGVVVVAHSMGGLLARAMLDRAAYGVRAKTVVGHVITIGTPHLGAPMGGFSYWSNISLCNATFVWWGSEAAAACEAIESSKAVSAMRPGSRQLAELPHFPDGLSVKAIAGDVRTKTCAPWGCSAEFSTGADLVVPVDSATAEYTTTGSGDGKAVFECFDPVAVVNVSNPWCGHNGMLKSAKVQGEVTESIKAYLATAAKRSDQEAAKMLHVGGLSIPARSTWKSLDDRMIIDTSTCQVTSEGDFWKLCAHVFVDDAGSLKEVWNMLCADELQSTAKSSVGGKATTLYKYGRCDAYESPGTTYLWHVPGAADIEYHLSGDGKPMAGIESALAAATWK